MPTVLRRFPAFHVKPTQGRSHYVLEVRSQLSPEPDAPEWAASKERLPSGRPPSFSPNLVTVLRRHERSSTGGSRHRSPAGHEPPRFDRGDHASRSGRSPARLGMTAGVGHRGWGASATCHQSLRPLSRLRTLAWPSAPPADGALTGAFLRGYAHRGCFRMGYSLGCPLGVVACPLRLPRSCTHTGPRGGRLEHQRTARSRDVVLLPIARS